MHFSGLTEFIPIQATEQILPVYKHIGITFVHES